MLGGVLMSEGFKMVATVLGGLALFVYGMGLMSDGLKATAGEKMKAVLGYMTRNRLFAILAGAGVTALVQSSSATSVMTVGFPWSLVMMPSVPDFLI